MDPAERVARFAAFVEKDPTNPLHNFALASAMAQAGDHAAAEAQFARCLELDSEWMVASIQRGRALIALERWEEARAALERGAELARQQSHEEPFEEIRELMEQIPGS